MQNMLDLKANLNLPNDTIDITSIISFKFNILNQFILSSQIRFLQPSNLKNLTLNIDNYASLKYFELLKEFRFV